MQLFQFEKIHSLNYFLLINNVLFEEHQLHENHYDKGFEILNRKIIGFFSSNLFNHTLISIS
jgi:hypothetical protein